MRMMAAFSIWTTLNGNKNLSIEISLITRLFFFFVQFILYTKNDVFLKKKHLVCLYYNFQKLCTITVADVIWHFNVCLINVIHSHFLINMITDHPKIQNCINQSRTSTNFIYSNFKFPQKSYIVIQRKFASNHIIYFVALTTTKG